MLSKICTESASLLISHASSPHFVTLQTWPMRHSHGLAMDVLRRSLCQSRDYPCHPDRPGNICKASSPSPSNIQPASASLLQHPFSCFDCYCPYVLILDFTLRIADSPPAQVSPGFPCLVTPLGLRSQRYSQVSTNAFSSLPILESAGFQYGGEMFASRPVNVSFRLACPVPACFSLQPQ